MHTRTSLFWVKVGQITYDGFESSRSEGPGDSLPDGTPPFSISMWAATEKRFQKAGSRGTAVMVDEEGAAWRGGCVVRQWAGGKVDD